MASSLARQIKRMESRKSYSWWWDSHINPKNCKWLAENLEEMDKSVKRMLKLIEEDGDSFAKKAEMYYKKRPELVSHVEEFYRMYRALAERYDHLTGELRKSISIDLQSQGSGISDVSSELPSTCPSPDQRPSRRKSGPRAAGFDFFLGSGGGNTADQKEGEESSSLTDDEGDSDDSSVNNYPGLLGIGNGEQEMQKKIIELEIELREVKEKLMEFEQDGSSVDGSVKVANKEISDQDLVPKIAGYEEELRRSNEKIELYGEEISKLNIELEKYRSTDITNDSQAKFRPPAEIEERNNELKHEASDQDNKIGLLEEELRVTKENLKSSEEEIARLKHELEAVSSGKIRDLQKQLESAHKEVSTWKAKLNSEKKEVMKLQERVIRLKTSLSDRDHEVRDLKIAVSDAEQKIFPEKAQIKAEISRLLEERSRLEEHLRDWESRGRSLEEEIRKIKSDKTEVEEKLNAEIERLKVEVRERDGSLEELKSRKEELSAQIWTLKGDLVSRDNRIDEMSKHLEDLHMEHVELIKGVEEVGKLVGELRTRVKELEEETERQRVVILEGAEEKREAIRQLCFSLEHYRNGYLRLRKEFVGHKGAATVC